MFIDVQLQKMPKEENKFMEMMTKVENSHLFHAIITKQRNIYDLLPSKIDKTENQQILKIYKNIHAQYQVTKQLGVDPNNWLQNEKLLFVWYIICYTYFLSDGQEMSEGTWKDISNIFFGKSPDFLHFHYLNLLKTKGRLSWSEEEDQLLIECIKEEEVGRWNEISRNMFFKSNKKCFKSPKHCRQRWLNHLDQNKNHGVWSQEQDRVIFKYVLNNGKKWCKIVPLLNQTRTEHMIKNRYNSVVHKAKRTKKLSEEEIIHKIIQRMNSKVENDPTQNKQLKRASSLTEEKHDHDIGLILSENFSTNSISEVSYGTVYPQFYNFAFDPNSLTMFNQFYFPQNVYLSQCVLPLKNQLLLSKQSNFIRYNQA